MSQEASQDLAARAQLRDERRKTRHRGISYRETAGGRSYYVDPSVRYPASGLNSPLTHHTMCNTA